MTALQRFMKTAQGVAVASAVAAVLYHAPQSEAPDRAAPAVREEAAVRTASFEERLRVVQVRTTVLDEAMQLLEERNERLKWGLRVFADIHEEAMLLLEATADHEELTPRDHLLNVSDLLLARLEVLKVAAAPEDGEDAPSFRLASVTADGAPAVDPAETLEMKVRATAAVVNRISRENAGIVELAGEIALEMDRIVNAAADPEAGLDELHLPLGRIAMLLEENSGEEPDGVAFDGTASSAR